MDETAQENPIGQRLSEVLLQCQSLPSKKLAIKTPLSLKFTKTSFEFSGNLSFTLIQFPIFIFFDCYPYSSLF